MIKKKNLVVISAAFSGILTILLAGFIIWFIFQSYFLLCGYEYIEYGGVRYHINDNLNIEDTIFLTRMANLLDIPAVQKR